MTMGTSLTQNANLGQGFNYFWWKNEGQYTVYDSFTGADNTVFDTGKWTTSSTGSGGSGTATIQSNQGAVTLSLGGNSTGTFTATSNNIPAGSSIYFEIKSGSATSVISGSSGGGIAGVNGVSYFQLPSPSGTSAVSLGMNCSIRVEYLGGTSYDIYVNGVYNTTITSASAPTIFATANCNHNISDAGTPGTIYIDNVRYK